MVLATEQACLLFQSKLLTRPHHRIADRENQTIAR